MKIKSYPFEIESQMRNFYSSLSGKDQRRYAAVEAAKSGHGGITYSKKNTVLEDMNSCVEVIVFPETFSRCSDFLDKDEPLVVQGTVQQGRGGYPAHEGYHGSALSGVF